MGGDGPAYDHTTPIANSNAILDWKGGRSVHKKVHTVPHLVLELARGFDFG